ncbi:MAG: hypothetical protein JW884_03170 [Deltaproteobacteria bacterium]|nr:hypothetical protein [Deltaproteobacteria bacterium]
MMQIESPFSLAVDRLPAMELMDARYSIHGLPVRIVSDSRFILDAVGGLLRYFKCNEISPPEATFYLIKKEPSEFPCQERILKEGRVLFDARKDDEFGLSDMVEVYLVYRSWEKYFMADFGPQGSFFLDTAAGMALGYLPDPESIHPAILSNFMFLLALSEMFRARDCFLIHSAAVMGKGKGILIPALSGSGKTTLCLSLLRGGFKYLSDDRPFLRRVDGGFEMLSFPEEIDVTEKTISLFPELRTLDAAALTSGLRKKKFFVDRLYPGITVDKAVPRILIFPKIAVAAKSRLRSLSKIEAVSRLLPHSLLVMDPDVAMRQFHMLCEMVETMDCYELSYGKDVLDVHAMIWDLL